MMRFVVALTGGIASGKTAVSDRFGALGVDVIDADIGARAVVAPGSAGLAALLEAFGPAVLNSAGALDRRALRERIFADPNARAVLESITHPLIRDWMQAELNRGIAPYAMLVVPLLAESPHYRWVDRVLLVHAPLDVRVKRLIARDQVSEAQATAAIAAQATDEARLAIANDVIDNAGDISTLDSAVAALHAKYLSAAAGS